MRANRRFVLQAALGSLLSPVVGTAGHAQSRPSGLSLMVAGPEGSAMSRWGNATGLALSNAFAGSPVIQINCVGGLDGVTGANQLDALVVPDGKTAAIIPGAALLAWLTRDPRVHFDPLRWVPVMAGNCPGVLVGRVSDAATPTIAMLRGMAPLKLAANQPNSTDLAALLALANMGVQTAPVFGLRDVSGRLQAFGSHEVDAVFLSGENIPANLAALSAVGGVPLFRLGSDGVSETAAMPAALMNLPEATAFAGGMTPVSGNALNAAVMAAQLDFVLVLPRLADASYVAQWRQAAMLAVQAPALRAAASASAVSLSSGPPLDGILQSLDLGGGGQAELQAYLAKSFGWQPS